MTSRSCAHRPGPGGPAKACAIVIHSVAVGPSTVRARSSRCLRWVTSRQKSRAGPESAAVEVSANEWARACNLRGDYWLYVVFDRATPNPRLVRVRDPSGALLAKAK